MTASAPATANTALAWTESLPEASRLLVSESSLVAALVTGHFIARQLVFVGRMCF